MQNSTNDRPLDTLAQGGSPNAYELLGLPLWTSDSKRIFQACRERIDRICESDDNPDSQQRKQLISESLQAQNTLTSPGARDKYNAELRSFLTRHAEQKTLEIVSESHRDNEATLDIVSPSSAETLSLSQVRPPAAATSPARTQAEHDAGSGTENTDRCEPNENSPVAPNRWFAMLPSRRSVTSSAKFIAAVVVTAVAINIAFFRPPAARENSLPRVIANDEPTDSPAATVLASTDSSSSEMEEAKPVKNRTAVIEAPPAAAEKDAAGDIAVAEPVVGENRTVAPEIVAVQNPAIGVKGVNEPPAVDLLPNEFDVPFLIAVRPLPKFSDPNDRREFSKMLRDMLYEGFAPGKNALKRSSSLFQQAEALSNEDPRLYYGYGLVLWKHLQYAKAMENIELAAKNASYWPAQQTLVRLFFARKQYDDGFDHLAELVDNLRKRQRIGITDEERQTAYWLGRLLGYLGQPANLVNAKPERIEIARALIQRRLNDELLHSYHAGQRSLNEEFAKLTAVGQEELQQFIARAKQQSAKELQRLEKDFELQKDREENVERTSREWTDWIDKQTGEADKQLQKFTEQLNELHAQAWARRRAIARLDADYSSMFDTRTLIRTPQNLGPYPTNQGIFLPPAIRRPPDLNPTKQFFGAQPVPVDRRTVTRIHLQGEFNALNSRANAVRLRANAVVKRRAAAVQRYQQATGHLVEKSDAMREWNRVLDKQKHDIKQTEGKAQSSPQAKAILRKAQALDTYIVFDPTSERQRLLDSLPAE
ncbi:MAG: hypothetical protein HON53_04605 [Planctomycetaceae bacterium]|jgi:hypothetical protein|nr:hypothetical protein [Planctomycetaceae bacterium]MBT6496037.1 hypothetical protein [Planctomycetaceae bacterium]